MDKFIKRFTIIRFVNKEIERVIKFIKSKNNSTDIRAQVLHEYLLKRLHL